MKSTQALKVHLLLLALIVCFMTSVVYAMTVNITQQRVKTLKAVVNYQDISNAPYSGDGTAKYIFISELPPMAEIVSAFIRVNRPLEHPEPSLMYRATLESAGSEVPTLLDGTLPGDGVLRDFVYQNGVHVSESTTTIQLYIQPQNLPVDLSDITSGRMTVYVNYLEH